MSVDIAPVGDSPDTAELRHIVAEYLHWGGGALYEATGISVDLDRMLNATMDNLRAYLPPKGEIYVARDSDGAVVGVVFIKMIRPDIAEMKRLFVRDSAKGQGIGRRLVAVAAEAAHRLGAEMMYLDTLQVMQAAIALYRSMGFVDIPAYPEIETPEEVRRVSVFLSLDLRSNLTRSA